MPKPKEILALEKELGFKLKEVDSIEGIRSSIRTFFIDPRGYITSLDLSKTNLRAAPNLSDFPHLEHLSFHDNKITKISGLAHLKQLQQLYLGVNKITAIQGLEGLSQLKELYLFNNKIKTIQGLEKLSQLQILKLDGNQITVIEGLEQLTELKELYLANNKIAAIEKLEQLSQLEVLNLAGNQITVIEKLERLTQLKELYLGSNKIGTIEKLEQLSQLQILKLDENQITTIEGLEQLTRLKELYLGNNKIAAIEGLEKLLQLQVLLLNSNQINTMQGLEQLSQLRNLYLDDNHITTTKGLEKLPQLQNVYLIDNVINSIEGLEKLSQLQKLDLTHNQISDPNILLPLARKKMPVLTRELYFLDGVNLYNNPLEKAFLDLLKKEDQEAILRYLERLSTEGEAVIHEAKITFVGEGATGKTSLQIRLLDPAAPLPEENTRTKGINITSWQFDAAHPGYIGHIWDFGGQDVYYPVHRFFLTEHSVFVLVASTRHQQHNFEYWIPTIFQFGGSSPIIIVQTCHEGNTKDWIEIGAYLAQSHFNIIKTGEKPYYEINLPNNNKGLATLSNVITQQVRGLQHFGKTIPKTWLPVREAIAAKTIIKPCISFEDFEEFCRNINTEKFSERVEVEDLAQLFHLLGILLWYKEDDILKNWVILQPGWAMNAVYRIIDDETIQDQNGHIKAADLDRLWKDAQYRDRQEVLKTMLQVFKIAFPKKNKPKDFIMPARMPSIPPEKLWPSTGPCLKLEYHFEFMPKALVNQLSADLSRYIPTDADVWNNAVNLEDNQHGCTAQVFEDFYNRRLYIRAKGKDPRYLAVIIMNALTDITDGYKGVTPNIMVPCICATCAKRDAPTVFAYNDLLELRQTRTHVYCNWGDERLLIDELLFCMGLPNPVKEKKAFEQYGSVYRQLAELLPGLIFDTGAIPAIATQAGLSTTTIIWAGNATTVWANTLHAALMNEKLTELVTIVAKQNPGNPGLQTILNTLRNG